MKKEDPGSSLNGNRLVRRIGITFNLKRNGVSADEPDDRYEEYDCLETIQTLEREIRKLGFETERFEDDDTFLERISQNPPDFVFNIAEGRGNTRGRESQVPCVLESLGIPFSGSDSVALAVTLDKWLTHHVLAGCGAPVPDLFMFSCEADLQRSMELFERHETFIVKPRWEGSSKGVFADSVVDNPVDLAKRVRRLWKNYRQPALVEEFLPGAEITVGVMGNRNPVAVGMMAIDAKAIGSSVVYSLDHKRNWEEMVRYLGPETIGPDIRAALSVEAVKIFRILELRDIARVDFRLDRNGVPKAIDVNPLPGVSETYGDFPILYRMGGATFESLIKRILKEAFQRQGLRWNSAAKARNSHAA
ncbi:MAG: ATP-grasp domain-containing protein [Thermovirgaceae bacterium]|nr:ATP-grasp domain-containing protein [Thermovirgaceae bacterium]